MRHLLPILLLAPPLLAGPDGIAAIRLEGARKLEALAREEVAAIEARAKEGAADADALDAARRHLLDARLAVVDAATELDAKARLALLGEIELLEARRYAAAQKRHAAGALDAMALLERRVAHQLAWIERHASQEILDAPGKAAALRLEHERQRTKVEFQASKERLAHAEARHAQGLATDGAVRARKRELIRAETAFAVAKERLRSAGK